MGFFSSIIKLMAMRVRIGIMRGQRWWHTTVASIVLSEIARRKKENQSAVINLLGGIVLSWALVERMIDTWVEVAHANGGKENIQQDLPRALKNKLIYLTKYCRIVSMPDPIRNQAISLVAEINSLKDFRHHFIHGVIDMNIAEVIITEIWKTKGSEISKIKMPYRSNEIVTKSVSIGLLYGKLQDFVVLFKGHADNIKNDEG